jgi:hypothetical protein
MPIQDPAPTDFTTARATRQPLAFAALRDDAAGRHASTTAGTGASPAAEATRERSSVDLAAAPDPLTLLGVGLGLVLCATAVRLRGAAARGRTTVS